MFWLDEQATPDVAEAWSNVVGFVLQHMLEGFLPNMVDPRSSYQNCVYAEAKVIQEYYETRSDTWSLHPSPSSPFSQVPAKSSCHVAPNGKSTVSDQVRSKV